MTVSIVIANWNTKKLIRECIESIFSSVSAGVSYELIIIDNASTDGSLDYLQSLGSRIVLISNNKNAGYAKACNQGMKIAQGKFILLLGSDTVMLTNTVKECIRFMESHPEAGAVGCRLLNPDGSAQNSCKKFPRLANAFYTYLSLDKLNREYDMASFDYNHTMEVEQVATTFLMTRKDLMAKIGYFDEAYRILYNDVDLCRRIWDTGSKIYFLHTCSVIHYGSHSTKQATFRLRKIMYGDIYRYYKNYFGFKARFLYPILVARLLIVSSIKA
jgi:O-antigen biosynthesis protein